MNYPDAEQRSFRIQNPEEFSNSDSCILYSPMKKSNKTQQACLTAVRLRGITPKERLQEVKDFRQEKCYNKRKSRDYHYKVSEFAYIPFRIARYITGNNTYYCKYNDQS